MRATLIEPCSEGRISGGFLYNTRIAGSEPALARLAVRPDRLAADLAAALAGAPRSWLVADSLFLDARQLAAFQRWRGVGHRLAILLHAFPSFVRRAAQGREALARSLPLLPTDEELELLEGVDLLIAPGPYAPRLLADRSRVPTVICPPGVDPAPAPAAGRGLGAGPVELISIGSVTPLKGFLDAVEALGRLQADFRWTIVGHLGIAPDHAAALDRRVAELELGGRVVFAGQRDHGETLASLRRSDLLLLTSFTENHPLVALEAMSAGVPVVGYAVGGLPDIVRHGEHGLLAPLLDVPALASCIAELVVDPAWRRRLADNCSQAARALPTWKHAARRFVETLAAQPL